MTDSGTASTTVHTPRVITADPVRERKARRALRAHRAAAPLAVAAGILTAVNVLPLLLDRIHQPFAQGAAAMARTLATSWPAAGTGELLGGSSATAAALLAVVLVVLFVAGVGLPDIGVLVVSLALAGLAAPAAWQLLDVVDGKEWSMLPPAVLSLVVLLCGLVAALRWRSRGSGIAQPVRHVLVTWAAVAALLALGAGAGVDALNRLSTASSSTTPATNGVAALEQRRSDDSPALAPVKGRWVAQLASDHITSDAQADRYLAQHDQISHRFPAILVRGDDLHTTSLDNSFWLTLTRQTFPSETGTAQWCTAQGLKPSGCMPRLVSTGP